MNKNKQYKNIKDNYCFNKNPENIEFFIDLGNGQSYAYNNLDNTFSIFYSINKILYLIYATEDSSLISYNIINKEIISKIKGAHYSNITNIIHYLDKINKRDLIMSVSKNNNNIKLWTIKNFLCILNIENIYNSSFLYSACFLNDNNHNYILTINGSNSDCIKVFNLFGTLVKNLNNSNEGGTFINSYYDNKSSKNYIITGNYGYAKSYEFANNSIYHKYTLGGSNCIDSLIIFEKNGTTILLGSSEDIDSKILIWNFHSGEILNKIELNCCHKHYGICLWNTDYLFVGSQDKTIKLIELNRKIIVKELKGHNSNVSCVKKFFHPKYGECLISQGFHDDTIKLWIIK